MIRFIMALLLAGMVSLSADTVYAEPKPSFENPRKIVFSVTEESDYAMDHILSVASNVLKYYGPDVVEMKIVAYSRGLRLLYSKNKETAVRVDALMQYGVTFVACGNTMRTYKVDASELVDGSEVVTAGVVELLERVKEGWTYIKP